MSELKYRIDLPVGNQWENVERVRESLLVCFSAMFADARGWHSFATVASELMENAIKYGCWEGNGFLQLRVWGDLEWAHVEVQNPVDVASDNVRDLLETIDWLRGFPSAEDAYRERMLEVAKAPIGVSRLGLARIAYEAGCELSAAVIDDTLRVRGVAKLTP